MKKIFIFFLSIFLSSLVYADPIKGFVLLGDSLSDNGNLYKVLKILPKSPPYYKGRFSNGPTWAEEFGDYLYRKFYIDYQIYAYGGATATTHNPLNYHFVSPITIQGELYQYLMNSLLVDKSKILYGLWIGANDYLYDDEPNIEAVSSDVVGKISNAIETLIKNGAQNFMVMNLPDLAKAPFARSHNMEERLHFVTQLHNKKLAEAINTLQDKYPKVKFLFINIYDIFNDLFVNPDKYNRMYGKNIQNTINSCWLGGMTVRFSKDNLTIGQQNIILNSPSLKYSYELGQLAKSGATPCADADEYIFWDELHPTHVVHELLAEILEDKMNQEGKFLFNS